MSTSESDRPAEKRGSKRKHLLCHECDIALDENYEFSRCPPCRARCAPPLQQEPTVQDTYIWCRNYMDANISAVNSSISELKNAFLAFQQSGQSRTRAVSPIRPMDVADPETREESKSSSDEEEDNISYLFPLEKVQRLLKSIRSGDQDADAGEASTSASRVPRAFKADDTLLSVMKTEWKKPEKGAVLTKRFKTMFPIREDQLSSWGPVPKVDLAVAKMSKRTVVPAEDGSSLQDPMDRKADCAFRRTYTAASAAASVAIASSEVANFLKSRLERVQADLDQGVSRSEILASFKTANLAMDFLVDAAPQQLKLASKAMALSSAGRRPLWLKPWKADTSSKHSLCGLPYEPGKIFGSELDRIMEGLSDKKGKSLPQQSSRGRGRRFGSRSTPNQSRGQPRRNWGNQRRGGRSSRGSREPPKKL